MKQTRIGARVVNGPSFVPTLDTPTIINTVAEMFESPDCLKAIQTFEKTGNVMDLTSAGNTTYVTCNNKALEGGTTTVLNPNTFLRLPEESVDTDQIPIVVKEVVEASNLPASVNQINRKRTMITRSLSRQASQVKEEDSSDPDYEPDSPAPPKRAKRSGAGRKPNNEAGLEDLPQDERERVILRRQKNKEAAARCRQKRVDLTNKLAKEVEEHQSIRAQLESEIKKLRKEQEDLRRILENHQRFGCALQEVPQQPIAVAIKSQPVIVQPAYEHQPLTKPQRPQTLLGLVPTVKKDIEDLDTPSKMVSNLFDAFTPTSIFGNVLNTPTCSLQQQRSVEGLDLSTPITDGLSLTAL